MNPAKCRHTTSLGLTSLLNFHALLLSLTSSLSHTIVISYCIIIPLSFSSLFTWSIHSRHGLPLNLSLCTSYLIVLTSVLSSIISTCSYHPNTHQSVHPASSSKHQFFLPPHFPFVLLHSCYSNIVSFTFESFIYNTILFLILTPLGTIIPSSYTCIHIPCP